MRIHICGTYGSGKSTLAKKLSDEFGIKNYSLDDIKYLVRYSKIRPVSERIKNLQKICNSENWITEGTWSNYAEDAFKKADLIILVRTSQIIVSYRILKRYFLRKKQENDTFFGTIKLIIDGYGYYLTKSPVSLYAHKTLIKKHHKKCLVLRRRSDIPKIITEIKKFAN